MNWYQLDKDEVLNKLKSSLEGLTEEEAKTRLQEYGPNKIAEEKETSKLSIFVRQFTNPLIYIMIIASVITFLFREYIDTGVILFIVLLNAVIGYLQEFKAREFSDAGIIDAGILGIGDH